jgi:hypothetical protein
MLQDCSPSLTGTLRFAACTFWQTLENLDVEKSDSELYSPHTATQQAEPFREALDLEEKDRAELAGFLKESLDMGVEEGVETAQDLYADRSILAEHAFVRGCNRYALDKRNLNC